MKSLFDETKKFYNKDGSKFSEEIDKAIRPIIKKWTDKGFSFNEMSVIITDIIIVENAIMEYRNETAIR